MWDERLAALAGEYETAVLSWVAPTGDPVSVRCRVLLDTANERVTFPALPPMAIGATGLACLLFHMHDEHLEGLRQLVIKGDLAVDDGAQVLRVTSFVTANGRTGTDRMPHAGAPLHMFQFYLLGRRKAREYLAKRGEPWPPIPYEEIRRAVVEAPD
jgi:hypothetical protein